MNSHQPSNTSNVQPFAIQTTFGQPPSVIQDKNRKRKTATPNNESNKRPSPPLRDQDTHIEKSLPPLPPSLAKNPVGKDTHIIQGHDHIKSPEGFICSFASSSSRSQSHSHPLQPSATSFNTAAAHIPPSQSQHQSSIPTITPHDPLLPTFVNFPIPPHPLTPIGTPFPVGFNFQTGGAAMGLPIQQFQLPPHVSEREKEEIMLSWRMQATAALQQKQIEMAQAQSTHHLPPGVTFPEVVHHPHPSGTTEQPLVFQFPSMEEMARAQQISQIPEGLVTPSHPFHHLVAATPGIPTEARQHEEQGVSQVPLTLPPGFANSEALSQAKLIQQQQQQQQRLGTITEEGLVEIQQQVEQVMQEAQRNPNILRHPQVQGLLTHYQRIQMDLYQQQHHMQELMMQHMQQQQQEVLKQQQQTEALEAQGLLPLMQPGIPTQLDQEIQPLRETSSILALTKAMKEGSGKMKQCNIILHGPPGVGKSSLKRVILGQPPLPKEKQNATPIIENAARAVSTNRLTASGRKMLAEVDSKSLIKMLAKKVKSIHFNGNKPQNHDSSQQQHIPESQYSVPVESVSESPLNTNNSEALRSIKEQLAEQVEPSSEIFDVDWITLIDSGGQPQFQDVLPLLYRNESLHIVVTRLDEGLDDKPKFHYYDKGEDVYTLPDQLTLSNREIIERACQIAEAQATSSMIQPKVMVVGTHKDKLGINGEAILKEINKELTKLHQKYNRVLIRKSTDEVIFAMNAMAPVGKERQQYTEELQDCILEAAEETGNEIDVPLKWLAFHLDIDKTGGIVRKSECYRRGEILGMGRSDVEEALKYLNKVGLLLYNPDDVPDLVFTKMDPLIGRLSRLITASFITTSRRCTAPYDRLRQKGLFNKSFLHTIFKDVYNCEEFSDDEFLKLLECLKIAVHLGYDDYFLPSALSLEPPSDDSSFKQSCVPLVYSWGEHILPHGFFLTFVVELLQQQESGDKLYFELRDGVTQCRDVIQVTVAKKKIPGFLKLVNRKRWIEICYSCSTTKYCSKLQEITRDRVQRVVKRFEHTCIKFPEIGFRCRLCDTDDHYCVLSEDQTMVQCHQNNGPVTPDMSCWIGSSQYSVCHLTTDHSLFNIFKRHMSEMLDVISDTERLANDLSSVDLISYQVKDDVITTNLSRYQKASKLLNEIERSLRVCNKPETLISYCEVLRKQEIPALTRIAKDMLGSLTDTHIL